METNPRMNRVEAALVRIAEKHEALAQTVEIIAGMQKENEGKIAGVIEGIGRLLHLAQIH